MLVLGDVREATDLVQDLAGTIPGVRGVYGGRLRNAHQVEALTANLITVNRRYKAHAGHPGHRHLRSTMYPAFPPPSQRALELHESLLSFLQDHVFPGEAAYERYRTEAGRDDHTLPPVVEELKVEARSRGLWNLFLPSESKRPSWSTAGELSGWSNELAPEVMNCQAPMATWSRCTRSGPTSRRPSGSRRSSTGPSGRGSR